MKKRKTVEKYIHTKHKRMFAYNIIAAGTTEQLQKAIVANGTSISIDGDFGPQTATAIEHSRMTPLLAHMYDDLFGLELPSRLPKWVDIGLKEIGVHEIKGSHHNQRVIEYMNATKWGKWVHDDETPWCAGFIGWCMVQAGYEKQIPDYSLGAKSWLNFGVKVSEPVLGAIAIKSRRGGGHVGIVVGISNGGKYLYILGGNQGDQVSVRKYPKSVWMGFRLPRGYSKRIKLAQWNGRSSLATTEA